MWITLMAMQLKWQKWKWRWKCEMQSSDGNQDCKDNTPTHTHTHICTQLRRWNGSCLSGNLNCGKKRTWNDWPLHRIQLGMQLFTRLNICISITQSTNLVLGIINHIRTIFGRNSSKYINAVPFADQEMQATFPKNFIESVLCFMTNSTTY